MTVMEKYLVLLCVVLTLQTSTNALNCSNKKSDHHRCDKIVEGRPRCFLLRKPSVNCPNNQLFCFITQRLCIKNDPICQSQCCKNWKEDEEGLCSISLLAKDNDSQKNVSHVSTVISGLVIGLLFVVLVIMSFATFRMCKKRTAIQRIQRRRSLNQNSGNHRSSVFTVYNNEPPPYDVIINCKLPEYSPRDEPPNYEDTPCPSGSTPVNIPETQSSHQTNQHS